MTITTEQLCSRHCVACEGGLPPLTPALVEHFRQAVPSWQITPDGQRLTRSWRVKDFLTALDFFQQIGQIAETEDHHPDLHLVGYRQVTVEIWTHAVGGLTENDFVLAAKIDQVPVELKR